MVYIPWANYGICKYWMLQRCYSGSQCKWQHPPHAERKRLWDDLTAKQEEDERRGIPPPRPPPKRAEDRRVDDSGPYGPSREPPPPAPALPPWRQPVSASSEQAVLSGRYGPGNAPPPPSDPVAPLDSESLPQWPSRPIQAGSPWPPHDERERPPSIGTAPSTSRVDLYVEKPTAGEEGSLPAIGTEKTQSQEVSMLDAPPSPKVKGENGFQPLRNANREPLGRNNRLRDENTDTGIVAGTWRGPGGGRRKREDGAGEVGQILSSGVPSTDAVTFWKRSDTPTDTHMTGNNSSPRQGGYWERLRERQAVKNGEVKNAPGKSREEMISRPNFPRGDAEPQTSSLPTVLSSTPHTTPATAQMGATKRLANGEAKHVGPHPSKIRVSTPYMSQNALEKKLQPPTGQAPVELQERSIAEAREDSMRLQGCTWLDNVRRALQLPIRTYTTACVYYHKFRLANPGSLNGMEYGSAWADACAASLLTSCKVEDTLKKSRDILAAAYNLKASVHDQLGSDDAVFEAPSRAVIGLERMVLEAGGFDFRSKYPHKLLVKIVKTMPDGADGEREKVSQVAWTILTDIHRTFAPLKQTSATMALASLELAAHLVASTSSNNTSAIRDELQQFNCQTWSTSREEIMETLLDTLDLYTQHTSNTILGTKYSLDDFLRIRLAFNKECSEKSLPRYTSAPASDRVVNGSTLRVANGHPTPVSPPQPGGQAQTQQQNLNGTQTSPEGGATLRFMLNPQLASDENAVVQKYFVEEWEEYEEEIEVPVARPRSRERQPSDRPKDGGRSERSDMDTVRGRDERDRPKEQLKDRERDVDRERPRFRDRERERVPERERDRRFEDRRDDRRFGDRDRRFDDRRDRRFDDRRFDDRRYEDDRRRRDDRR